MAQEKEEKTAGQEKAVKGKRKIHFSIDDFFTAFIDLTENRKEYSSLFEQPVCVIIAKTRIIISISALNNAERLIYLVIFLNLFI